MISYEYLQISTWNNPQDPETDNDGCTDGDEVLDNLLYYRLITSPK